MTWQILIAISIIASAAGIIFQKYTLRDVKVSPLAFGTGFQILTGLLLAIPLIFGGFHVPNLGPIWINLLLTPTLYIFANIARFKAMKHIDVSKYTVISQATNIVSVIAAVLFLHEAFRLSQVFGLICVIIAILIVTIKEKLTVRLHKGELLALISSVLYGLAIVNDFYILRTFDLWSYTSLSFLVPGLITLVFMGKHTPQMKQLFSKKSIVPFASSALLYGVMVASSYAAYQIARNAAQIQSITPVATILVVIFAAIFLHERDHLWRKLFAAILAVIGIALLQ